MTVLFSRLLPLALLFPLVPQVLASQPIDLENGEEINEVCAGCHGEYGQGGKAGKYPRLAGLPAPYIAEQLKDFRSRSRPNMPMVEHVDERQMPDEDIQDIAAYLARIELPSKLPPVDEHAPGFNAYARLLESKKVVQIPRAPGNVQAGKKLYHRECASCHGRRGEGRNKKNIPMLAGQYTNYLWRQVRLFHEGKRHHDPDDPDERLLDDFSHQELKDIFAWLSTADD